MWLDFAINPRAHIQRSNSFWTKVTERVRKLKNLFASENNACNTVIGRSHFFFLLNFFINPIWFFFSIAKFFVASVHLHLSYADHYCSRYKLSLFNFKLTICKSEEAVSSRLQCRYPNWNATTPIKGIYQKHRSD